MSTLAWILAGGIAMSAIALVGSATLLLSEAALRRLLLPLVALAAGTLLGGALFHMLPAALEGGGSVLAVFAWAFAGFASFFLLEQLLHWHHCHRASAACKQPLTYLILVGDGLHNLIGGLGVGAAFLIDTHLGITAWLAAAAHEVPQELGDFGVLVHGGWTRGRALLFNVASAATFPLGGVIAWAAAQTVDVAFLVPFAAGNFVYIAASDLVPEVNKHHGWSGNVAHAGAFLAGAGLLFALRVALG